MDRVYFSIIHHIGLEPETSDLLGHTPVISSRENNKSALLHKSGEWNQIDLHHKKTQWGPLLQHIWSRKLKRQPTMPHLYMVDFKDLMIERPNHTFPSHQLKPLSVEVWESVPRTWCNIWKERNKKIQSFNTVKLCVSNNLSFMIWFSLI